MARFDAPSFPYGVSIKFLTRTRPAPQCRDSHLTVLTFALLTFGPRNYSKRSIAAAFSDTDKRTRELHRNSIGRRQRLNDLAKFVEVAVLLPSASQRSSAGAIVMAACVVTICPLSTFITPLNGPRDASAPGTQSFFGVSEAVNARGMTDGSPDWFTDNTSGCGFKSIADTYAV